MRCDKVNFAREQVGDRLGAQDTALSRLKHGFESRWGHHRNGPSFFAFSLLFRRRDDAAQLRRNAPNHPPKWQRRGSTIRSVDQVGQNSLLILGGRDEPGRGRCEEYDRPMVDELGRAPRTSVSITR